MTKKQKLNVEIINLLQTIIQNQTVDKDFFIKLYKEKQEVLMQDDVEKIVQFFYKVEKYIHKMPEQAVNTSVRIKTREELIDEYGQYADFYLSEKDDEIITLKNRNRIFTIKTTEHIGKTAITNTDHYVFTFYEIKGLQLHSETCFFVGKQKMFEDAQILSDIGKKKTIFDIIELD